MKGDHCQKQVTVNSPTEHKMVQESLVEVLRSILNLKLSHPQNCLILVISS